MRLGLQMISQSISNLKESDESLIIDGISKINSNEVPFQTLPDSQLNLTDRSGRKPPTWQDYEGLEVLGEGSYGKIYKVREKNGK